MNQMLAEYKKEQHISPAGHNGPDRFVRGMLLHIFLLFLSRLYQRQFDTGIPSH